MSVTLPPPGVVVFDYPKWKARYPEFAAVTDLRAQAFFDEAGMFCDNTASSPICDLTQRGIYLNMLTAHLAALNGGLNACGEIAGGSGVAPVGRLASASEGSVSASYDYAGAGNGGPSEAWYLQTPYGAMYWAMTAQFRTWRYFVGPQNFQEFPYGYNYGYPRPWPR